MLGTMNYQETRKKLEEIRKSMEEGMPNCRRKPGLSMFNDSYDTVAVVPVAALAAADEQAQKTPDSE